MLHYKWLPSLAWYTILPLLIVMIGCGGPPANNPLLNEARAQYEEAHNDESIVRQAPVELKEAEEALVTSTNLWEAKADKSEVDHYAYLASKKTLIARETALMNAAQQEISRGETERQQVMLDVRRAEAERSERRATSAMEEANQARAGAEESRRLAEELAKKVSELEARPTERGLVLTLGDVLFDTGQANLKAGGMQTMNQLGEFLNEYPDRNILVEGFTDSVGSEEFNMALSTRRAESVKNALMNKGVRSERIRIHGFGTQYPVASNATAAGRSQNRRVEVVISNQDGIIEDRTGSN